MEKLDFKKTDTWLYTGKPGRFDLIDVPPLPYLMLDGMGDPNSDPGFGRAVSALYGLSYGAKFHAKATLGHDHAVAPLEGLWWADDMTSFATANRAAWRWTVMIRQPDWITPDIIEAARAKAVAKLRKTADPATDAATLTLVRLDIVTEGLCLQTLHIGSYADEAPVIARLHGVELPARGMRANGKHHEIYLSDPGRTPPEKLRTLLRQPVSRI